MKALSGKDFCKLLEHHGWSLMRINGSHHVYGRAGSVVRISVPVHSNNSLKFGLARPFLQLVYSISTVAEPAGRVLGGDVLQSFGNGLV
jgi:predicted RNA binding protein YcfA (HicA-like mRNA interferase family)